jgi:hypothetical protein
MTDVIGILPHLIIVPIATVVIILLGFGAFGLHKSLGDEYNDGWFMTAVFVWIVGIIGIITSVMLFIPFDSKYHNIYRLQGTVESVTNVLEGDGDGERTLSPIIKLSGYSDPIEFSNSRITTLKGREVVLTCTYEWQMHGLDITNCELKAIK